MRVFARIGTWAALIAVAMTITSPVAAQLPVPEVQLPQHVPEGAPLPGQIVNDTTRTIDRSLRRLTQARITEIGRLNREHSAELDRDPAGELVVRAEVVAIDISESALQTALAENFQVRHKQELPDLGVVITVLQAPQGWSAKRGLAKLRELDPQGIYDYNHVYLPGGRAGLPHFAALDTPGNGGARGRVGVIDGGIDDAHQVFQNVRFTHFGCDGQRFPGSHGTAVAALLVTQNSVAEVFAADVYCGKPAGGAVDTVAAALAWLARERVAVINVSLVGPRNALLERVVDSLVARGFLIVAAVGNDGPAAPPLYPASYPGVVGVTAVDSRHRVLVEACRGAQVDFAARGADMQAASQSPDSFVPVRGTSFAAPVVAGLMAADLASPDVAQRDAMLAKWTQAAKDLGKKGRDDVYGSGELGDLGSVLAEEANK